MALKPNQKEIATKAYLLWEAEGRQSGRDSEYWSRAEVLLTEERVKATKAKKAGSKKIAADKTTGGKKKASAKPGKQVKTAQKRKSAADRASADKPAKNKASTSRMKTGSK